MAGIEPRLKCDVRLNLQRLHNWTLFPELVPEGGVVYSLGVGEDIGFDLELIRLRKVSVHAFDPTPNSVNWLSQQDLPDAFHFHPYAIADEDGVMHLYPRVKGKGIHSSVMYTKVREEESSAAGIEVSAKTIPSIMREFNHHQLDVLKMDIEGSEYAVLEGVMNSELRPVQLMIEFHHRFPGLEVSQTEDCIQALREQGYALAHISSTGREFSFVLRSALSSG